eukprot:421230_1
MGFFFCSKPNLNKLNIQSFFIFHVFFFFFLYASANLVQSQMKIMILVFTALIACVIGEIPPSQFNSQCKYVMAGSDSTNMWPIDYCYKSFNSSYSVNSHKWKCEFNITSNATIPQEWIYQDTTCQIGYAFNGETPNKYNCGSSTACPFVTVYEYDMSYNWNLTMLYNDTYCKDTPIIINETILNLTPDTNAFLSWTYALNICNDKTVLTCDDSTIYKWKYNDNECQDYNDYEIFQMSRYECNFTTKWTITECDMKDVDDPFAPTNEPTKTPTKGPLEASETIAPTKAPVISSTDDSHACILSCMVNLVVLAVVSFFVTI